MFGTRLSTSPEGKFPFIYPVEPVPRTAVLVPWFRQDMGLAAFKAGGSRSARGVRIRIFRSGWSREAAEWAPAAVAGRLDQLLALDPYELGCLTHAQIALRRAAEPPVSERDRALLWERFGVPVYEQVIGKNGDLLASECETHRGLHVYASEPDADWFRSDWVEETDLCPCGRSARLIIPMAAQVRAAAAGTG